MARITCRISDGDKTIELEAPDIVHFDNSKAKNPWHVPPISELFSSLIGKIAFVWADFENEFDLFLEGLSSAVGVDHRKIQVLAYKSRAKEFRSIAATVFEERKSILRNLDLILGKAGQLQEVRNHLAHGRLNCDLEVTGQRMEEMSIKTTLVVSMRRSGKVFHYSPTQLDKNYYAMAHLSGLMHRLSNPDLLPNSISSQDRPFLLDFLSSHHPRTNEGKLQPHPLSSLG